MRGFAAHTENRPISGTSLKKLKKIWGIFKFLAIPNDVLFFNYYINWGKFGPSKLWHIFFVFQIFVNSGVIFAIKSCLIN